MKLSIVIILSFLCQCITAGSITVCPTCQEQDLMLAYEDLVDGDTMIIRGGQYTIDNWIIAKSITILGESEPLLKSKNGGEIITISAHNVTIKFVHFTGVTTNYLKENAAIRIRASQHFLLEGNTINSCFFAIYLERAKHGVVKGNIIHGNASTEAESGNGIHGWYCDFLKIVGNEITHHRDGIYLEFVNESLVANNHSFQNTRYGLHYMFSNDDIYENNVIKENGVGVAVMFSRRIIMKNNTFSYNWGNAAYGLLLKEIYDAEIIGNQFDHNTVGIFVEGSNRINYRENNFTRNGWAIKFSGGCELNEVTRNNFLYNSVDLIVSSKISDNSFDGNFWSAYTGYDLDKNGIGDVPYYPVKLYSYINSQVPESVVLMRSLFVEIINFAEKVSPVFTPKDVLDQFPKMQKVL